MSVVSATMVALLCVLSLLHVYWAVGGKVGLDRVIPEIDGKAAFTPSAALTLVVAGVLLVCGAVALWLGDPDRLPVLLAPYLGVNLQYVGWVLALAFAARVVGDFKLVGVFKKIKDSKFAEFDSKFYVPLCAVMAVSFVFLSAGSV